eukprot:c17424_g1_i2 orf=220-552(+)
MAESFSEEGWQKCCCGRSRLLLGSRLNSTGYICSCLGMTKEKLLFYLVGHKSGKVMEHDSNRTHISDTTTSSKPGAQSAYLDLSEKNETKYTARSPRRPGLDRRNPGQTN